MGYFGSPLAGLNSTVRTGARWPSSFRSLCPPATSQTQTVRSSPPDATRLPSGLRATQRTAAE